MEIKLNAGDRIQIPEGCVAVIENDVVYIEQEYKDGDILAMDNENIAILKGKYYCGSFHDYISICDGELGESDESWDLDPKDVHPATEEQKQILFDKMAEEGLRWNAEEKRVEKMRWKPNFSNWYYYIDYNLAVSPCIWKNDYVDRARFNSYNCFRTGTQTEQAAKLVKETLRKFHEENY